jgi:hypothetical protein
MADARPTPPGAKPEAGSHPDAYHLLRRLGGLAYQLRATARAGDHFLAQDNRDDRDTGGWLISCAVSVAEEVTQELDGLAYSVRERPADGGLTGPVQKLRARAHQLKALSRGADHFLDQDSAEDRSTGSWLVACALAMADKLAAELDDLASNLKRVGPDSTPPMSDVTPGRRPVAVPPLQGLTA